MKKNKKRAFAGFLSAVVIVASVGMVIPTFVMADDNTLHISSVEDLKKFAENCRLDTYSQNLKVVLDNDLDLKNEPFSPIPTFSGSFDGQYHTIKGFVCANDGSNQGLFRYVQETGTVSNLNVEGKVEPTEGQYNIGGVVGTNYGQIDSCTFDGTVKALVNTGGICGYNYGTISTCLSDGEVAGKQYTGGICGYNEGSVIGCVNEASVNIEIRTGSLDISNLTLLELADLQTITINDTDTVMDTGGIVGGSSEFVTGCTNNGVIGYQHFGYNVGGIAGRQSGFLTQCENYGEVYGRKDVAGICGQMEPHLYILDEESLVDDLQDLNDSIANAMSSLGNDASAMSGALNSLKGSADAATVSAQQYSSTVKTLKNKALEAYQNQNGEESDGSNFGETASGIAGDVNNIVGGLDQSTKDDILNGNANEDTWSDVQDSIGQNGGSTGEALENAGGVIEGDINNVDQDTIDNIQNGNVSSEDISDISGAVSDSYGANAIRDAIAAKQEQEAAEQAAQLEQQNSINSALANAQNSLAEKVQIIGGALASLNDSLAGIASNLATNMQDVNSKFEKVNRMITRIMTGDMTYYDDISVLDTEEDIDGKVSYCKNYGLVNGDENVGGVAGEMAIEKEIDAGGNVLNDTLKISGIISTIYETRSVIRSCENNALIQGRKSDIGGVVGNNDTGVVFYCQNYGDVKGDSDNVGGIAGDAGNIIAGCYSMCNLSGISHIGGIVGNGVQVTDSFTFVTIEDETSACSGAIAGYLDVTKDNAAVNNYFVSNSLGAIDGISYGGKAEPTTYEEMVAKEGVPEEFKNMIVSFVADDVTVKVVKVPYGGSIKSEDIPDVPQVNNYVGVWEDFSLDNITNSMTVHAVYDANQSSMAANETREDGLPILLVEGDFEGDAEVTIEQNQEKTIILEDGTMMEVLNITLENVGDQEAYRVRYLPMTHSDDTMVTLYKVLDNGSLEKINTETKGSYLAFTMDGTTTTFAAVLTKKPVNLLWFVIAGAGVLVLLIVGLSLRKKKHPVRGKADRSGETVIELDHTEAVN